MSWTAPALPPVSSARALAQSINRIVRHTLDDRILSAHRLQTLVARLGALEGVLWIEVFDSSAKVIAHTVPERVGRPPIDLHDSLVRRILQTGEEVNEYDRERNRLNRFVPVLKLGPTDHEHIIGVVEIVMDARPVQAAVTGLYGKSLLLMLVLGSTLWLTVIVCLRKFGFFESSYGALDEPEGSIRVKATPDSQAPRRRASLASACVLLSFGIFAVDISLPLGIAGGIPYALIVLVTLWSSNLRDSLFAAALGTALTIIGYFLSAQGGVHWMVLTNRFLALFAIWVTAALVVQRKRSEASQRESDGRFLQFAENIEQIYWITSSDGRRIIYVSSAYEAIWGRSVQQLYEEPLTWIESVHPEDRDHLTAMFFDTAGVGVFDQEYRIDTSGRGGPLAPEP